MKKITVENYRTDRYYPRVVAAVSDILATTQFVAAIDVFVQMGLLRSQDLEEWRAGRLPYLEKAIKCNLSSASRILRLLRMHAHDLNLRPSATSYVRRTRSRRLRLRFTKTGDLKLEEAYARHFLAARSSNRTRGSRGHIYHPE